MHRPEKLADFVRSAVNRGPMALPRRSDPHARYGHGAVTSRPGNEMDMIRRVMGAVLAVGVLPIAAPFAMGLPEVAPGVLLVGV